MTNSDGWSFVLALAALEECISTQDTDSTVTQSEISLETGLLTDKNKYSDQYKLCTYGDGSIVLFWHISVNTVL